MLKIANPPPNAVNEEWNESTAPVEVPVVEVANSADAGTPKRVSLPSMDAPASFSAVPGWAASNDQIPARIKPHREAIVARIAYPCRLSLTISPKVRVSATGISSRKKISRKFVNGLGFSNGCAEFAL